jgi:hypothetical protein
LEKAVARTRTTCAEQRKKQMDLKLNLCTYARYSCQCPDKEQRVQLGFDLKNFKKKKKREREREKKKIPNPKFNH